MHYNIGDQVVVRIVDTNQIGIITNIRKKKNQIIGYDLRTERGNAFVVVQVDKPKSTYSIDSQLTSFWGLHSDQPSNLHINRNLGHTRANYNTGVPLEENQYEKCDDFTFPVVGPRSW